MFAGIFLEVLAVGLPLWEVHKRVAILIEHAHQAGEIHLSGHLEVEKVAANVDAALHQVVVVNRGCKGLHCVGASAVAIDGAVEA